MLRSRSQSCWWLLAASRSLAAVTLVLAGCVTFASAQSPAAVPSSEPAAASGSAAKLPVIFEESFDHGTDSWQFTDPQAWKIESLDGNRVLSQFQQSDYAPPHRSPLNIALLKEIEVGSFELTARVRSTIKDYGHRDVCLFFGYQDPAHFYYVHLGKQADDHANQVFIVNEAPRIKISLESTEGTPWDDEWHTVRIIRDVESGVIEVYFDDLEKPIMRARNQQFTRGRIGVGSFDDTSQWDNVRLRAKK